jgi:hypothetical protein
MTGVTSMRFGVFSRIMLVSLVVLVVSHFSSGSDERTETDRCTVRQAIRDAPLLLRIYAEPITEDDRRRYSTAYQILLEQSAAVEEVRRPLLTSRCAEMIRMGDLFIKHPWRDDVVDMRSPCVPGSARDFATRRAIVLNLRHSGGDSIVRWRLCNDYGVTPDIMANDTKFVKAPLRDVDGATDLVLELWEVDFGAWKQHYESYRADNRVISDRDWGVLESSSELIALLPVMSPVFDDDDAQP